MANIPSHRWCHELVRHSEHTLSGHQWRRCTATFGRLERSTLRYRYSFFPYCHLDVLTGFGFVYGCLWSGMVQGMGLRKEVASLFSEFIVNLFTGEFRCCRSVAERFPQLGNAYYRDRYRYLYRFTSQTARR